MLLLLLVLVLLLVLALGAGIDDGIEDEDDDEHEQNANIKTHQTHHMKIKQLAVIIALGAVALSFTATPLFAAEITDQDKQFLTAYGKVHDALVADNLPAAKAAAKDLGADGKDVANAGSLKDARAGFGKLSQRAEIAAAGQSGYRVMHCPMLKKDWVQTGDKVANPYGGSEMISCGEVKS